MISKISIFKGKLIQLLLLVVVVLTCLFYSHLFIDYALLPKLFVLSLGLSTIYFFKSFSKTNNKTKQELRISTPFMLFSVFVIYAVSSILWSTNIQLAYLSVSKLILALLLLRLIINELSDKLFMTYLIYAIAFASLISNAITLIEILNLTKINHHTVYRITGAHGHKNLIASFNYLAFIITSLALHKATVTRKAITLAIMTVQLFMMLILQCRGVYIALIIYITSLVVLYTIRSSQLFILKKYRYLISTLIFLICVNVLSLYIIPKKIKNIVHKETANIHLKKIEHNASIYERLMLWDKSYDLFFQNPWLGVGSNNWQIQYPKNTLPNIKRLRKDNVNFQRPHNDFIWILCEYGIIGFNIIIIALWFIIYSALVAIKEKHSLVIRLLLSGLFGYLAIASVSYPLERIEHNTLLVIIIGLLIKHSPEIIQYNRKFRVHSIALFIITSLLFLFITSVSKSDYHIKKIITNNSHSNQEIIKLCNKVNSQWYTCTPFTIPVSWYKGNTYVLMEQYSKAYEAFAQAKQAHPFHASTLGDYGSALYMMNNKEEAVEQYAQAIMINPDYTDALYNLINVLIELKKYNEALNYLHLVKDPEYHQAYKDFIEKKQ